MPVWRYLADDAVGAAEGPATDEAMLLRYGRGGLTPASRAASAIASATATLRLYTYRPHCALVGRYQSLADEVDLDFCADNDVEVGRRPTGGGAIIMGPGQLGIAVASAAVAEEAPRETLRRYADGVLAGLRQLGIEAAFRSKNDLEVEGRKIAGLGLYLDPRGAVLFHASVLVDLDVSWMLQVLRIPGAKLAGKATGAAEALAGRIGERVTTVSQELGRRRLAAEVRGAFVLGFSKLFEVALVPGNLDEAERAGRDRLVRERYNSPEWVHQRSPRRDARGTALLKTPEGLLRVYVATHGEVIKSALITGDFNLLPAGIADLEAGLRWCPAERQRIREVTASTLTSDALGVPAETLAATLWEAVERALELQHQARPVRLEGSCYFPDVSPEAAQRAEPVSTAPKVLDENCHGE